MSHTAKEQTRQHILEKATHLFQTQGYARTTTQEIAKQADIAEVTLFRHFGNKQKIISSGSAAT